MSASGPVLKVAQLVETLGSGGAEALAVDIAGALVRRGHESHLIVLRGDGPFRRRVGPGVRFCDLGRPRTDGGQCGRLIYFAGTCRELEAHLRQSQVEVLQTHLPKANFLGLAMALRRVCRVHATVHNNREFDYGDNAGILKQHLRRACYRGILRHCDGVIAVSEQVRQSLLDELQVAMPANGRFRVVRNGVQTWARPTPAAREAIRANWGVGEAELLVVGVGRLTPQKNFGALVSALANMPAVPVQWKCIIAGEGEERAALEQQIADRGLSGKVLLAGLVADVRELLDAADIFCLPSRYEGLPLVLLEAMAAHLPVAACAINGVRDVVEDRVQARLAPADDPQGLGQVLSELLMSPEDRARLGRAGHDLVCDRYSFGRVVDQLEVAYRS